MPKENVFVSASQKAKEGMAKATKTSIERPTSPQEEKIVNVRVTPAMHKRMMIHRLETGESMNALLVRLLEAELGKDK